MTNQTMAPSASDSVADPRVKFNRFLELTDEIRKDLDGLSETIKKIKAKHDLAQVVGSAAGMKSGLIKELLPKLPKFPKERGSTVATNERADGASMPTEGAQDQPVAA